MLKKKEAMMVQAWRRRGELALLSLPLHNYNKTCTMKAKVFVISIKWICEIDTKREEKERGVGLTMKNASAEIFYLKLMDVKVIVSINA
jgi:hypothetical protein